mmetsp:Transcript_71775/g.126722  ORF Transcript_71775/g.126722 Transcript_71775/m.126722 type:complete len:243 (+) Transcript_71775:47-775(+)|eukprot:CAMPEP_0197663428 /NCGR_PEP_ID=MMETSP1338-20131121/57393_1 /TAXON_ID=43686 ORGANISM="Pelagodinium beii, Strain RCC1491" /NCGR_SAMPLE_ID=MMETSP1338 /ASSEMBLY_ACC=CAM_ASM_000754 /LENGTH=242 /DNA_ID=CAMNT_0043241785 /DNA_START=47 /DNA_END=775 /DNA_ORIENTATION=-
MELQASAQAQRGLLAAAEGEYVAPAAVDQYFELEPNLIAAFDFDYDTITEFQIKQRWLGLCLFPPVWVPGLLCCVPCYLNQNVHWEARSQHVALTVDGIRYVKEQRKSLCGLPCTDKGRESKTVPYDKITDCDVKEPAGMACCCCLKNVLSTVHIDTASSGAVNQNGQVMHELELRGLVSPTAFKHSVWAMKRRIAPPGASVPMQAHRGLAPAQQDMTQSLLVEIRDELKTLNQQIRQQNEK